MTQTSPKPKKKQKLVLLDVHAIIHRAYHALPEFSTSAGVPTGGLYGVISMIFSLIDDLDPDYIVACYDLPKPTYRHELFKDYKAGRKKADPELVSQIIKSRDIFEAFAIPMYDAEGFEADDILGTIAEQMSEREDVDVVIASGDMDTLQLVKGTKVQVYTFRKGLKDTVVYSEKKVKERYQLSPIQLIDYKGLRGDPSDNIPGVKGIGEKGATDLLLKFKTLDTIFAEVAKGEESFVGKGFTKRVFKLLSEQEEEAQFSKMLATIRLDAPITFELPENTWATSINEEKARGLFDELEFRTYSARLSKTLGTEAVKKEILEPQDPRLLEELKVMLWVYDSNLTDSTFEEILRVTETSNAEDAQKRLTQMLTDRELLGVYTEIEKPLIGVLQKMTDRGVLLDTKHLDDLSKEIHKKITALEKKIYELAGKEFNINSPKQLGEILYDDLGIVVKSGGKTAGGARSTREDILHKIKDQHEIVDFVLEYRELFKLVSTYIDSLPELLAKEGRLHPRFLQYGTTTGRFASENPNIQNIPVKSAYGKDIRKAFIAPEGFSLLACDYSQVELRIAAFLSGDEKLIDTFKNGDDIHTSVAAHTFDVKPEEVTKDMRRQAKVINFGILYGMGVSALQKNLGVKRKEAQEFYDTYFKTFDRLAAYMEETKHFMEANGYTETFFGRRRYFEGMNNMMPHIKAQAERMAVNAPIQGTSADIIKIAMSQIDTWITKEGLESDVKMILQIHDELIFEVKDAQVDDVAEKVVSIMQNVLSLDKTAGVPFVVGKDSGKNWGSLKSLE